MYWVFVIIYTSLVIDSFSKERGDPLILIPYGASIITTPLDDRQIN